LKLLLRGPDAVDPAAQKSHLFQNEFAARSARCPPARIRPVVVGEWRQAHESGDVANCGVCMSASTTASLLNCAAYYDVVIGRRFLQQPFIDTEIYRRNLIESPL
jgi:hypothetical protein